MQSPETSRRAVSAALEALAADSAKLRRDVGDPSTAIRLALGHLAGALGESSTGVLRDLCGRLDRVALRLEELAVLASVGAGTLTVVDLCPTLHGVAADARAAHGERVAICSDLPIRCVARVDLDLLRRFLSVSIESRIAQGYTNVHLRAVPGFEGLCRIELRCGPSGARGADRGRCAALERAGELIARQLGTTYRARLVPVLGTLDVIELPEGSTRCIEGAGVMDQPLERASESA
ncbi:hypothetical protein [Engelhardtia mirabilis]|uniref:Uncharacterized protein n=1 Tax=Engelhardtia mirabilis TaxID=2528011 RepID=A0A518BJJ8_9BACT|nr:hypothetical protein Pla133_22350 [Planctomycetes bacterium Pla133]QDV01484.1 hypothetical protein Pla86_22350 [Planctomycetes bacterium Pla86]